MRGTVALILVLLVAAGCGSASPTIAPTGAAASPALSSPVVGIVTAVDSRSLGDVRGLTLRVPDGRQIQIAIGTLDNGASFPPGHLAEHIATAEPIRVYFRQESGGPVAYRIEDAGAPASGSEGASPSPS